MNRADIKIYANGIKIYVIERIMCYCVSIVNNKEKLIMARQIDSHRMQLRLPAAAYEMSSNYADEQGLSLNGAIIDLVEKGLNTLNDASLGYELGFEFFPLKYGQKPSENPLLKVKEFFSYNSQYKLINVDSVDEGIVCWFYKNNSSGQVVIEKPSDNKLYVYVYLPSGTEVPYYFPPVIDDISKNFSETLSFRGVSPVRENYFEVQMTFELSNKYPMAYLPEMCESIKKLIKDKTGFESKTKIEKEIL
ncbi:hypothetical protein [Acinetobacter sp. YH12025]|uniref:hypothetical protein n=1 Tax=Acinetobacter sp. YH12025 TaxID=2601042 RepID=UPI0015D240D9|nr:hypothetical protein [Acinetobacter sp. YH12025]